MMLVETEEHEQNDRYTAISSHHLPLYLPGIQPTTGRLDGVLPVSVESGPAVGLARR